MKALFVSDLLKEGWRDSWEDQDSGHTVAGEKMTNGEMLQWFEENGEPGEIPPEFEDRMGYGRRRGRMYEGYGQKDLVRMEDIRTKSAGDHDKEIALASTQARLITKPEKAKARAEAAEEVFGAGSDIANIFGDRAVELGGSYVSSEASSGTLAPLTSADPKAERKFKTKSHLPSERVNKAIPPAEKGGGFVRGAGVKASMGIGRYAEAPETSDEYLYRTASVASLGKINLGTGDSKYFNVIDNSPDGTIEIWKTRDGRLRGVMNLPLGSFSFDQYIAEIGLVRETFLEGGESGQVTNYGVYATIGYEF